MEKYFVFVWSSNKPFTSLSGKEILAFITLIPEVVNFIQSKYIETTFVKNLCSGMSIWKDISQFKHRTVIPTNNVCDLMKYEDEIAEFKQNVQAFYKYGYESFLTKNIGWRL